MKVLIISGSPKGKNSVTLQSMLYLEKYYDTDDFSYIDAGAKIRSYEKDFSEVKSKVDDAEVIVFSYPVYPCLATAPLFRTDARARRFPRRKNGNSIYHQQAFLRYDGSPRGRAERLRPRRKLRQRNVGRYERPHDEKGSKGINGLLGFRAVLTRERRFRDAARGSNRHSARTYPFLARNHGQKRQNRRAYNQL